MKNFKVKDLMISIHPPFYPGKEYTEKDNKVFDGHYMVAPKPPACRAVSCKATKPTKNYFTDSTSAACLLNLKQTLAGMQEKTMAV